ncbi:CPBP family intramembrane metalloprotease [Nocardiopsis sp. EMB25]|uniref:CPBP family intramembrane glutamic endopeptidase n=1 Tax=Nocardiopsis sp. EMB25 TaxID=2835867 RepID=UPI002283F6BD|nr:CPBP family intramembrane glutamic endopeptidase [Nocardiopsis sp. EMB25]MCY9785718.1 CPBP family intramembrane metalloprotease [Nocardiopsis sp. EMB25]
MRTSGFAPAEAPEGEPYHRLARGSRYRWWVPPLSLLVLAFLLFFLWVAVALALTIVALAEGGGLGTGSVRVGEIASLAIGLVSAALLIPIVLLVVRVVQWRRVGTLMSVEGRMRWPWLGRCVALAVAPVAVSVLLYLSLSDDFRTGTMSGGASSGAEVAAVSVSILVILLLVPFQSVAEEVTLRGLVMQWVGSLGAPAHGPGGDRAVARVLRSPAPAILASGTLFAALYASAYPGDVWTTATLTVMGTSTAWLTWRTGGLEAAIGLHLVNGLVQLVLCVLEGRTAAIGTGVVIGAGPPGMGGPFGLALAVGVMVSYALTVTWFARRAGLRRTSAVARA